jgi:tetratricopeptide (TPR) repeat protein
LRPQVADALVTRGDEAFRSGDGDAAIAFYERALMFDEHSALAADRLAFQLAMQHQPSTAKRAIRLASRLLAERPDVLLLADRVFAEMQLREWTLAERDFALAGSLGRDARYDHLAGRMALRVGKRSLARALAKRAIAEDPRFAPAHALLRQVL